MNKKEYVEALRFSKIRTDKCNVPGVEIHFEINNFQYILIVHKTRQGYTPFQIVHNVPGKPSYKCQFCRYHKIGTSCAGLLEFDKEIFEHLKGHPLFRLRWLKYKSKDVRYE